jgi:hypothetical protein
MDDPHPCQDTSNISRVKREKERNYVSNMVQDKFVHIGL